MMPMDVPNTTGLLRGVGGEGASGTWVLSVVGRP